MKLRQVAPLVTAYVSQKGLIIFPGEMIIIFEQCLDSVSENERYQLLKGKKRLLDYTAVREGYN